MELSVGDKVRVHYHPAGATTSFIEGIVDQSKVKTFYGLSFSMQVTREVILGREAQTVRNLPCIIRYEKEDDFEGRIEILEPVARTEAESVAEVEPEAGPEPEALDVPETVAEPEAVTENTDEDAQETVLEADSGTGAKQGYQKRGWKRFLGRTA
jgi:hypothetical protein